MDIIYEGVKLSIHQSWRGFFYRIEEGINSIFFTSLSEAITEGFKEIKELVEEYGAANSSCYPEYWDRDKDRP